MFEQGKFNKNELDQIFSDLGLDRKFNYRLSAIGSTPSTYTGWTHVRDETGYSIWKFAPTNYIYHASNEIYMGISRVGGDIFYKTLSNKGQANSEDNAAFSVVYFYNADSGPGFTDHTTEAGTEEGTEFELMDTVNDYFYVGSDSIFTGCAFEFQTRGSGYTIKIEYYDGDSGGDGWSTIDSGLLSLVENTSNFESNGAITWSAPIGWITNTVNSSTKYWIRFSTTSTPGTVAKAYSVIPYNSVPSLLALSSEQIQNEDWAYCSFSDNIYVTIRNTGNPSYEGDYYITSASSAANLRDFFAYKHPFAGDFQDTTYTNIPPTKTDDYTATASDRYILVDADPVPTGQGSIDISLPAASDVPGQVFTIKCIALENGATVEILAESGETIDGSAQYSISTAYDRVSVLSNGTNWYVINTT